MEGCFKALCLFFAACSGSNVNTPKDGAAEQQPDAPSEMVLLVDGGSDGADDVEMPPIPGFDLPHVVSYGGPTMANPKVVPIFFADEDGTKKSAASTFLGALVGSAYWTATTKEYGVGALSIAQPVSLAENAPVSISESQLHSWIASAIGSGKLPPPDASTIYLLYYPQATTIHAFFGVSCIDWSGFHDEISVMSSPVVFAVVAGCASDTRIAPGEVIQGLDFTTGITSHELVEAVTDPFVSSKPAYASIDAEHRAWQLYLAGGEVADMCELEPGAFYKDAALGWVVQRTWSNAAAAVGRDPCVPAAGSPFVAAYPKFFGPLGAWLPSGSTTISVELESDGPTNGPWNVKAIDWASENGLPARLSLSLAPSSGQSGDMLMLTIGVLAADVNGYEGYILESEIAGVKRRVAGLVRRK